MQALSAQPVAPACPQPGTAPPQDNWLWHGFLSLFVHSSVWVAGAIASLSLFVQHALDLPADPRPFLLLLGSALFVYNLDHVVDAEVRGMTGRDSRDYFGSTPLLVFLTVCALWTGVMVGQAEPPVQIVFAIYSGYGLFYGVPALPWRSRRTGRLARLKDIGPGKSLMTASVVVLGAVGVPLAYADVAPSSEAAQVALWLWVICTTNMHMCDVRDLAEDAAGQQPTLPVLYGARRTRMALVLLNLVVLLLSAWGWASGVTTHHPEVLVAACFTVAYVLVLREDTEPVIYDIVVDGVAYLPALLALGAHVVVA